MKESITYNTHPSELQSRQKRNRSDELLLLYIHSILHNFHRVTNSNIELHHRNSQLQYMNPELPEIALLYWNSHPRSNPGTHKHPLRINCAHRWNDYAYHSPREYKGRVPSIAKLSNLPFKTRVWCSKEVQRAPKLRLQRNTRVFFYTTGAPEDTPIHHHSPTWCRPCTPSPHASIPHSSSLGLLLSNSDSLDNNSLANNWKNGMSRRELDQYLGVQ